MRSIFAILVTTITLVHSLVTIYINVCVHARTYLFCFFGVIIYCLDKYFPVSITAVSELKSYLQAKGRMSFMLSMPAVRDCVRIIHTLLFRLFILSEEKGG